MFSASRSSSPSQGFLDKANRQTDKLGWMGVDGWGDDGAVHYCSGSFVQITIPIPDLEISGIITALAGPPEMLLRMPPSSSPLYCQVAKLGREMRFWSTMHVDVVFHPDNAAAENLALPKSRRNCWFPLISSSCVNSFHAFWEFGGIDLKVVIYW